MRCWTSPSLARTLAFQIVVMIAAAAICAASAVYTVSGLHQDFTRSQRAFAELTLAADIGTKLELARADLGDARENNRARVAVNLDRAAAQAAGAKFDRKEWRLLAELIRHATIASRTDAVDGAHELADAKGVLATLTAQTRQELAATAASEEQRRATLGWIVGVVSAAAVLVAAVVGIAQYRAVMRPTRALSAGVTAFSAGDFSRRLAAAGPREFARLADDFNRMAAELERLYGDLSEQIAVKSRQLALSQRLASVGYLAAGVSHEINNPLAIITAAAERVRRMIDRGDADPKRVSRTLGDIIDEAFRCKAITDKLLALSRPAPACSDVIERRATAIDEVTREVVDSVRPLPAAAGRTIHVVAPQSICAAVDESEFRQLLLNLLTNALDATASVVEARINLMITESNGVATLEVADDGRGIAVETIEKIFEPFFTAMRPGGHRGTGLGLSIAHAIARAAGGDLTAASRGEGAGSRFTLTLPVVSEVVVA